jgi:hypothetical protein
LSTALSIREIPLPALVDRLEPLASALDGVSHEARVNFVRGLGWRQLGAMWEHAKETELKAADLLHAPADAPVVTICEGKNALPVFSWFQKRFARVGDEIVGYNHNSAFVTWWVGPGHFVAYDAPDKPGEVWIDYRTLPKERHPEFPELASNDRGLFPRATYGGMVDKLRRVSRSVVIGDSFLGDRQEKPKYVKFALVIPESPVVVGASRG